MNVTQNPNGANKPPGDPRKQRPSHDPAEDEQGEELEGGNRYLLFNVMPSWMVSFITHIAVIVALAVIFLPSPKPKVISVQAGQPGAADIDNNEINLDALDTEAEDALELEDISEMTAPELAEDPEIALLSTDVISDLGNIEVSEDAFATGESLGELSQGNETSARTGEGKKQALLKNGGTQGSEDAVQLALKWIVDHQLPDGSWSLDHTQGPGDHRNSPNPGTRTADNGATALALLPLLGAGNTHLSGQYKKEVHYGLEYLKRKAKRSTGSVSFMEPYGRMYSHGLCAIVFNEAYAMTQDPDLRVYAQGSIWFTEQSQDPQGGGWRYVPRERGDTSAVGWQMMALKSGKISGLDINPRTYKRAEKFLNGVSNSSGAYYGYMDPPLGPRADARSAIGLLCRMYMGWDRDVPGLVDGMELIADKGPSTGDGANMYYNYYATQGMKHMYNGREEWKVWNTEMRDFLIDSQAKKGDAAGSWHFDNRSDHASGVGGRLYNTAMACMTLEVYYRFLPLYGNDAASDEFELID